MNIIKEKTIANKINERVEIYGKNYNLKIIYKNIKIIELNIENNNIIISFPNKYKKINKKNILKIKDLSKIELDLNKIKEENNLKIFFIKEVLEMQKENNYTDEEIENAIQIGLQAIQN